MKHILFRGYKINYLESGHGQPMLLLHNGGSGNWIWKYQIEYFAKKYRVIAPDLLGCGLSDRPYRNYDLDLYTDMLSEIVRQLDLKNIILVGNCIGATTALEYATRDSSQIAALILFNVCGGLPMMSWQARLVSRGGNLPKFLFPVHRALLSFFASIPGAQKAALRTVYGNPPNIQDPVYLAELKEAANPLQASPRIHLIRGLPSFRKFSGNFERSPKLPSIYLFWGEKNKVLLAKHGARFAQRLLPKRINFVKNTGHFLMAEAPTLVNHEIDNFLSAL